MNLPIKSEFFEIGEMAGANALSAPDSFALPDETVGETTDETGPGLSREKGEGDNS